MTLQYLLFDHSEASDGTGVFDAMATVRPERIGDVQAEIDAVLHWARSHFPDGPAPVEDGGYWDAAWQIDDVQQGPAGALQVATLSIGGSAAFCEAFATHFADALA